MNSSKFFSVSEAKNNIKSCGQGENKKAFAKKAKRHKTFEFA